MPRAAASFGECNWTGLPSQRISPWSCVQMPAIVLISVLLPAPLSPTSAVTCPTGTSRLTSIRTRTGPKFLPMPTRRSSGSSPLAAAVAGARANAVSAWSAATSASTAAVSAWAAAASAWTAAVSAGSAGTPGPGWPGSGAGARPVVAGRASSALGVVTGRASLPWRSCRSLGYPGGLAEGRVLTDAELRGLHELVRDHGRVHVLRGHPLGREIHRRHWGAALGVVGAGVHQGGRRLLAGPHEHGQGHGGLRLKVDRLVDGAALVAGQDVLQADRGRVLAGDREGLGLDALGLQVVDDRRGVRVVRGEDRVDVLVRGEVLLELAQRHRRGPGAGRLGHLHVLVAGEERVEHAEVPLREQGGVVVGRVALHHQHVRLADVPGRGAGGEALADLGADQHVVEADVVLTAAAQGQPVVVDDGHAVRLGVGLD